MAAQGVDGLRSLPDQKRSDPKDHRYPLGFFALHGHEAHRRALRGFTNCLGVGSIILLPLDEVIHLGGQEALGSAAASSATPPDPRRRPMNLKTFFARSSPTVVISDMTALLCGSPQTHLGTSMPSEGGHIVRADQQHTGADISIDIPTKGTTGVVREPREKVAKCGRISTPLARPPPFCRAVVGRRPRMIRRGDPVVRGKDRLDCCENQNV